MEHLKTLIFKNVPMKIRHYREQLLSRLGSAIFYTLHRLDKKTFQENYAYWNKKYASYQASLLGPFIVPAWKNMSDATASYFASGFSDDFLKNDVIKNTMFFTKGGNMQKLQLLQLKKQFGKKLSNIITEHPAGRPHITSLRYLTSHNTIHHASHMANFAKHASQDIFKKNRILEWGGGYGNFARILKRQRPDMTYTIIDLPVFSFIQATYLSTVFGKDSINLITSPNDHVISGKINIIPLNEALLGKIDLGPIDVFVSTWALSESTDYAQAFVERTNFFNAESILIAHQARSDAMRYAEDIAKRLNQFDVVYHEQIPYLKTDYYLFATSKRVNRHHTT